MSSGVKTKEEILKEALDKNGIRGKGMVVAYPVAAIDAAMDQYAEQEAIAFAEWMAANDWINYPGYEGHWAHLHTEGKVATTSELYNLYKQQVNNNG